MKALAITHKGLENISAKEIKELVKAKTTTEDSVVLFDPKKITDLCLLCYKAQSIIRVLYLLDASDFKELNDIGKLAKKIDFSEFIDKKTTFAVRCIRQGDHNFSSQEVEEVVGNEIKGKVNLTNPDVTITTYLYKNKCYIGVDFSGEDLSKRQYRIFANAESIRATVAYSLLRIADYNEKKILIDPFCSAGTIAIEAALYVTSLPVNFYTKDKFAFLKLKMFEGIDFDEFFEDIDKKIKKDLKIKVYGLDGILNRVVSSRKNAKIAGVDKKIKFSKVEPEWLDTKFEKNSVDIIVSKIPFSKIDIKKTEKIYKELFYQLKYVLSDKGKVVLLTNKNKLLKTLSTENGFKIKEEMIIEQGKQEFEVIVITK